MSSTNRPLPDPNDPMVERILAFRLSDIKTAIDNRDGAAVQRAIEELSRELHPDLADKVLQGLRDEGLRTIAERIGKPIDGDADDTGAEG